MFQDLMTNLKSQYHSGILDFLNAKKPIIRCGNVAATNVKETIYNL